MNLTHILIATTTAVSLVATVGCSSNKPAPEEAAMTTTVPPAEPVAAAPEAMPSHPALAQSEPAPQAAPPEAPMVAAAQPAGAPAPIIDTPKQEQPMTAAPADEVNERAPRADRN